MYKLYKGDILVENMVCPKCDSQALLMKGKIRIDNTTESRTLAGWRQRWRCKDCGKWFTEKKVQHTGQDTFDYEPQEWAKTNWTHYNKAQINEKRMLIELVDELLDLVTVKLEQKTGRPPQKVRDMIFCMLLKTYTGLSSRRLISDLKIAKDLGHISKVPCYSTVMLYFNDKRLQRLLQELVHVSAIPLKNQEEHFSVDSSGFSTSKFGRWYDHKWDKETQRRIYKKAHIMVGTFTNVVTSIQITDQYGADCTQFVALVKKTALNFQVKEVTGDKAYCSRANYKISEDIGAKAYIPFKSNMTGRAEGLLVWRKMYDFSKNHPQAFGEKYHKRSNVESTFNMIKQKFGSDLMTKNHLANVNEILCKVLCHNLCCLISAYYELNVETSFCTQVPEKVKTELVY